MKCIDADLIILAKQHNKTAFESLVNAHKDAIYRWCYSLTKEPEEASDIAQETFIQAYRKIHLYEPFGSFRSWLIRIAYRYFLSLKEKERRRESAFSLVEDEVQYIAGLNEEKESIRDDKSLLMMAMEKLPEEYRICLTMRYIGDLSISEIASATNLTESNVKVRLFRAKALLSKAIPILKMELQ